MREGACVDAVALMGSGRSERSVREGLERLVWRYAEALGPGRAYRKRCLLRSQAALGSVGSDPVFDLVVPRRVTVEVLRSLPRGNAQLTFVRAMMAQLAVGCLISPEEDAALAAAGLTRRMPEGWNPWTGNPWDRYAAVGLSVAIHYEDLIPGRHEVMMREAGVLFELPCSDGP